MFNFEENNSALDRIQVVHPTPWKYNNGVISDVNNKVVADEKIVGTPIFDVIWSVYFLCLMR